jgi:hypothetical protein
MTNTVVVCDNTLSLGLAEKTGTSRTRHSKHSGFKVQNVRDAIGVVHTMADSIMLEIEALASISVSDKQFFDIVNRLVPIAEMGSTTNSARTKLGNKQDAIYDLYSKNPMVAPWTGTKLGVIQAFNTYAHHMSGTDKNRAQRNLSNAVMGKTDDADSEVLKAIDLVLTA